LSSLGAFVVLSGIVGAAGQPVPAQDVAEAQLRVVNHRFVGVTVDVTGDLMEDLTHHDFLLTDSDGSWRGRAEFVADQRRQPPLPAAWSEDMHVRLFGPVALVHGVFTAPDGAGRLVRVRYTDVHVWSDTAWRLVSVQNTPLADGVAVEARSAAASAATPWKGHDPAADDASLLRALNDSYVKAFREADVAWYGAHLAPDYVMVSADGALWDRAAALSRFAQPMFATAMRSFDLHKVTVRRFHDVALIHAENTYQLEDGRKGVSRYTDIWYKQDGRWLCVAAHINAVKAPDL
jgi:uncharacterized protein (TIGR02246 family)